MDGLRLLAAVMVMTYHYTDVIRHVWSGEKGVGSVFPKVVHVTAYGWLGVDLFFVISGFVICLSAWGRGLGKFFVSRAVRLYPAYWFAVLATAAALTFLHPQHLRPPLTTVFVNLTMLQQPLGVPAVDGVYWTLWEELHFYLLFAALVWWGLTYRRVVVFCMLWTVASVVVAQSKDPVVHLVVGDATSPFFVAGIAFFLMYRFGPNFVLWGIVGVSWALGLHNLAPTAAGVATIGPLWRPGVMLIVTGIFAVIAAIALGWLDWIRGRWLVTAGALTYPLYLLHANIGYAIIARLRTHVPRWPLLLGVMATMLVFAWLVHRFVERPLAPRLKRVLTTSVAQLSTVDRRFRRSG